MNTANQLKQLADQHHLGTIEMDTLLAITERIGRTATIQAQQGKYEMTISCDDKTGFNEYLPANHTNIRLVEKELHKHGYDTKLYCRADEPQGYIINIRWGTPHSHVRMPHIAIMNSRAPF